jgi:hypothetical protein
MEPYHRRSILEEQVRSAMIEAYVRQNHCRYDVERQPIITASPKDEDQHKFTPVERITLDFEGKF